MAALGRFIRGHSLIRALSLTTVVCVAAAATVISGVTPDGFTSAPRVGLTALAARSPTPPGMPHPPVARPPAPSHPANPRLAQRPAPFHPATPPSAQRPVVVLPPGPLRPGPRPGPRTGHGPGWDGNHGAWDGHSGFGRGGGWDGVGGGWDGYRWWVSPQRCMAGHGRVTHDPSGVGSYCQGGIFAGAPIRF